MAIQAEQDQAKALIELVKSLTPTFEVSENGVRFTDNGVTGIIPTTPRTVIESTTKIR
jgi:hypothetical protein